MAGSKGGGALARPLARTSCQKRGCSGFCPTKVILRCEARGAPCVCKVCERPYPKPPAKGSSATTPPHKASEVSIKSVLDLNATHTAKLAELSKGAAPVEESGDPKVKEAVRCLRQQVASLRGMDEGLHHLCDHRGGHAAHLGKVQAELDALLAGVRATKPLKERKSQAEAFLARVLEAHQRAKTAAAEAEVELAALVKKVDGLKEAESAALRKVDAAKLEVATLAEEVAARLRDELPAAVGGHAVGGVAAADVPLAGAPRVHPIEAMPELPAALRGIPEWEA